MHIASLLEELARSGEDGKTRRRGTILNNNEKVHIYGSLEDVETIDNLTRLRE